MRRTGALPYPAVASMAAAAGKRREGERSMNRALRILAVAGVLALIVYGSIVYGFYAQAFVPFQSAVPALYLMKLFGAAGFALTFAAGVVAIVASLQRRQRWWAALLTILTLAPFGVYLVYPLLPLLGLRFYAPFLAPLADPNVALDAPATLLALAVLAYSFIHSGAASAAPRTSEGAVRR